MACQFPRWMLSIVTLAVVLPMLWGNVNASDRVVLATVAGVPITSDDIIRRVEGQESFHAKGPADPKVVAILLDEIIIDTLVSKEAMRLNLDQDYEFWSDLRRELTNTAIVLYQDETLGPQLNFDSSQINAYYRANSGRYTVPHQQRFVRHITAYFPQEQVPETYALPDSVYRGWDPQAKIESIYQRLADGEDFAILARAHSEDPHSKGIGGVLGWVSKESLPKDAFGERCLRVPLYQISKPFKSAVGWHIVQVTDVREPGPGPIEGMVLADIIRSLRDSIGNQLATRVVDSLLSSSIFEVMDKNLDTPDSLLLRMPGAPMAVANGRDTIFAAQYLLEVGRAKGRGVRVPVNRQERTERLRSMQKRLVLYNALRTWGYLTRPEVTDLRAERIHDHASERVRALFTGADFIPDSASVARYYHAHPEEFTVASSYLIRFLKFNERSEAEKIAATWRTGTHPDSLETAWVRKGDVPEAVWSVVTKTTIGTVMDPLAVNGQFWVVLLSDRAKPKSLGEAFFGISTKLQSEHYARLKATWLSKVTHRYPVIRYPDRYAMVLFP